MGCDIDLYVEMRKPGREWEYFDSPTTHQTGLEGWNWYDGRCYSLFSILAGVRNYAQISPISKPRGVPSDSCDRIQEFAEQCGVHGHTHSWYTLKELLDFDWDKPVENRRITRQLSPNCWDGRQTCELGEGEMTTYRALDGGFGDTLKQIQQATEGINPENVRLVFWFDN